MSRPCRRAAAVAGLALVLAASAVLAALQTPPGAAGVTIDADDFVEIPGGSFTMGAGPSTSADAFANERWSPTADEGTVDLPTFYLARREVTVGEFAAFAQATGWRADARALQAPPTHPVAYVAWTDAIAYGRWLTRALASAPTTAAPIAARLKAGWRITLPTEAQWEKAARGADRRLFPWGMVVDRERATYQASGPTPVGQHPCPACAHGLEDMAGNVWEWTRSPYQPYPYDDANDREGLDADALWVMRGGGFADAPRLLRTTARGAAEPGARRAFIGFRVALVPASARR